MKVLSEDRFVVVLILSYNGKHLLPDSIDIYLSNIYSNFRIVVIDNGSSDGTESFILKTYPKVEVIRTEVNLKYSGALTLG